MFYFYCITGALSIIDDYCVSYTVTMVDVRYCSRPPRLLDQHHISKYSHMSMPPILLDNTRPLHLQSINIGTYMHTYVHMFYCSIIACLLYLTPCIFQHETVAFCKSLKFGMCVLSLLHKFLLCTFVCVIA